MRAWQFGVMGVGWLVWFLPFVLAGRPKGSIATIDRRARWGMIVQGLAYALVWQNPFWLRMPTPPMILVAALLFLAASALSWMAVRALGRQWRMDAGLNRDHQLVRTGVYRVVRHPIYASMLCVLVAVGVLVATPPLFIAALIIFLVGTEIRVHVEERLLSARFGREFDDFKRQVPAYLPPVR